MLKADQGQYQLIVNFHDQQLSKRKSEKEYNKDGRVVLKYDADKAIFYEKIKESLPLIKLGGWEYHFMNNDWYIHEYENNWAQEYYRLP